MQTSEAVVYADAQVFRGHSFDSSIVLQRLAKASLSAGAVSEA